MRSNSSNEHTYETDENLRLVGITNENKNRHTYRKKGIPRPVGIEPPKTGIAYLLTG